MKFHELKNEIRSPMIGLILNDIGRASDMVWLSLGTEFKKLDYKGRERTVGQYAVHLQCPWRLINSNIRQIIVGSSDVYEPKSSLQEEYKLKQFNWDVQGDNLFDEKVKNWFHANPNLAVSKVELNDYGDLSIEFSDAYLLESFHNSTFDDESWRFMEDLHKDTGRSIVLTGKGFYVIKNGIVEYVEA